MTSDNYKGLELMKMFAEWCGPCKQLDVIMKDIEYTPIDIDEMERDDNVMPGREVAKMYRVSSVPTLLLVDQYGNEVDRSVGLMSRRDLNTWLESNGYPEDMN